VRVVDMPAQIIDGKAIAAEIRTQMARTPHEKV
jgi:hypothetical protein